PRAELRAGPGHEHGLARLDDARRGQRGAGLVADLDLVAALPPAGDVGDDPPGQAWRGLADSHGLPVMLEGGGFDTQEGCGGHEVSCSSAQPLMAPAVMPETILRLKKMKTSSGGIVISAASMNSRFHCELY